MLGGAAGDLADAQSVPRHRHRVEDDGFMRVEPGRDLADLGLHRRRREGGEQAAAFLLLSLLVRAEYRGLRGRARIRPAVGPVETPDGES